MARAVRACVGGLGPRPRRPPPAARPPLGYRAWRSSGLGLDRSFHLPLLSILITAPVFVFQLIPILSVGIPEVPILPLALFRVWQCFELIVCRCGVIGVIAVSCLCHFCAVSVHCCAVAVLWAFL